MADLLPGWVGGVLAKVEYASRDQCWRWRGRHNQYGRPVHGAARDNVSTLAARRVLAIFCGRDVRAGFEAHHTCEHPWCVNPWHLRPLLLAGHRHLHRKAPVACSKGHDYTPENTGWTWKSWSWKQKTRRQRRRYCKRCNRERVAAAKAARKAGGFQ